LTFTKNQSRLSMRKPQVGLKQRKCQRSSQVTKAIDLYSASIDDMETVCCFFHFQEINESPKKSVLHIDQGITHWHLNRTQGCTHQFYFYSFSFLSLKAQCTPRYKRSHLIRMGKKNKKIIITNHQRRNKSSCPNI
jgi:hypothetical protein